MGSNLVSWKSKKQSILAKSSAEAEYRAMNSVTCEVMWILKIFKDLNVNVDLHVSVSCDRSSAIQIAANLIKSEENVADLFTKGLSIKDHQRVNYNVGPQGPPCLRIQSSVLKIGGNGPKSGHFGACLVSMDEWSLSRFVSDAYCGNFAYKLGYTIGPYPL
ncbi:hypothetical protein Tco_1340395 [Tanacetum coccineum]